MWFDVIVIEEIPTVKPHDITEETTLPQQIRSHMSRYNENCFVADNLGLITRDHIAEMQDLLNLMVGVKVAKDLGLPEEEQKDLGKYSMTQVDSNQESTHKIRVKKRINLLGGHSGCFPGVVNIKTRVALQRAEMQHLF